MSRLAWIADPAFEDEVANLLSRARAAMQKATERVADNVIDPFLSVVAASTAGMERERELAAFQATASMSSSISSAVGNFHQRVLSCVQGFENHDAGYDIENKQRRIIAEIKNKHNTMSSTTRSKVVADLDTAIMQKSGKDWEAYLVIVLPKKPVRYKKQLTRRNVYEMDGVSFYDLATGHRTALSDLYNALVDYLVEQGLLHDSMVDCCKDLLKSGFPD